MTALKRLERWLTAGGYDDHARGLYEGGMFALDLRAVLALAKEAAELKRRVRRIRAQARWLLAGNWTYDNAKAVMSAIDRWTDLRRPLPKRR